MGIKKVNLAPTPALAYVMGVCFGDGSVWKYTVKRTKEARYIVSLRATDFRFVSSFKKALESIGLTVNTRVIKRKHPFKPLFVAEAYSKMFYEWFSSLDLEKVEMMLNSEELIIPFIRGFYESEGNFKLVNKKYPYCRMFNTSRQLLELIQRLLRRMRFNSKIYDNYKGNFANRTVYCLSILGGAESVKEFIDKISPVCKVPADLKVSMCKPHWKKQEIELLREHYNEDPKTLKSILPGRSQSAIYHKTMRLKKGGVTRAATPTGKWDEL